MPTVNEHLRALQRAKAAGDHEVAEIIRADLIATQQEQDRADYNPTTGNSFGQNLIEGVGQGATNVGRHVGNLAGLVSDERLAEAAQEDAALMATGGGKVGSILGEGATFAVPMGGAASMVGRAGARGAAMARNLITRGAAEGAAQGAIMADPGERMAGALQGGAFGAALPVAHRAYKGLTRGIVPTKSAARLMKRGVDLTPSQMNRKSVLGRMEETGRMFGPIREAVDDAREAAHGQFTRALAKESLPPGVKLRTDSADPSVLMKEITGHFNDAYKVGEGFEVGAKILADKGPNIPLNSAFTKLGTKARGGLPPAQAKVAAKEINELLNTYVQDARASGNPLKSDDLFKLRSTIRAMKQGSSGPGNADKALRNLYGEAEDLVTRALDSQLPPKAMSAVRAIDSQYGKAMTMSDAVARGGTKMGGMTAHDFAQAVKQGTPKSVYARGGGRMRELADAGVEAFGKRRPETGFMAPGAAMTSAALYSAGGVPAVAGAGLGAAGLIGTQTGRRLASGRTRPQELVRALERSMKKPRSVRIGGQKYNTMTKRDREIVARLLRGTTVAAGTSQFRDVGEDD